MGDLLVKSCRRCSTPSQATTFHQAHSPVPVFQIISVLPDVAGEEPGLAVH